MNTETILSKQVNDLAIKLAESYLQASNYKAQAEILAEQLEDRERQLAAQASNYKEQLEDINRQLAERASQQAELQAVLDSDPALRELFEEVKAKLAQMEEADVLEG